MSIADFADPLGPLSDGHREHERRPTGSTPVLGGLINQYGKAA
jgi:hypothetical protein